MTLDEFRKQMGAYRNSAEDEAKSVKDPQLALDGLRGLYRSFDANERAMANQVLAEWVLSDDENMRFDALALIDDLKIKTAAALRSLAARLSSSSAPGATYELRKVDRMLRNLGNGMRG